MIHYNNYNIAYSSDKRSYSINKYILIRKKPIVLFTFRDIHLHLGC